MIDVSSLDLSLTFFRPYFQVNVFVYYYYFFNGIQSTYRQKCRIKPVKESSRFSFKSYYFVSAWPKPPFFCVFCILLLINLRCKSQEVPKKSFLAFSSNTFLFFILFLLCRSFDSEAFKRKFEANQKSYGPFSSLALAVTTSEIKLSFFCTSFLLAQKITTLYSKLIRN